MADKLNPAPLAYQNETFINSPDGRIFASSPSIRNRSPLPPRTDPGHRCIFRLGPLPGRRCREKHLTAVEADSAKSPVAAAGKQLKRALAAVEMARYYEDARRLAFLLTEWSIQIPARRRRFVVTTGGGPGHHGGRKSRSSRSRR